MAKRRNEKPSIRPQPPVWLAWAALLTAGVAVYANSLDTPFVFDGAQMVRDNPQIRALWPPDAMRCTRPVVQYSFALSYALGGTDAWGYHVANMLIHVAAGITLFEIVRRTLASPRLATRFGQHAWGLGLVSAAIWLVHPLQTQSVTYIYQRYESMMGLFYLLTLYAFVRAQSSARPGAWYALSSLCCVLAIGSKEVAVTVPVMVLWYDRAFLGGSWGELWRKRKAYYGSFAAGFVLLAGLMTAYWANYAKGGALVVAGVSPWQYARTQPEVILHYLRMSVWPQGQCLDYAWPVADNTAAVALAAGVIAVLAGLVVYAMFRRPEWGFLGGWFFITLAPTSSVAPIVDLANEHRMYLPLASVAVAVVLGGWTLWQRWLASRAVEAGLRDLLPGIAAATVIVALGGTAMLRNAVYRSDIDLWGDVLAKSPRNARAHYNLAHALETEGHVLEAIEHYREAVRLNPADPVATNNLANLLASTDPKESERLYRRTVELAPDYAAAYDNLAKLLEASGRSDEAIQSCRQAVKVRSDYAPAYTHLGYLLMTSDPSAALKLHEQALELDPNLADAHSNLAGLLADRNPALAVEHYRAALTLLPENPEAHYNLANVLYRQHRYTEAIGHLRESLRLRPDWPEARRNLTILLKMQSSAGGNGG
jgi:tetratricopeptide (TPR) repeat protein